MALQNNNHITYAPLSALMVEALRNEIIEGKVTANQILTEDSLASNFGVSRVVVREALQTIESEGLIIKERNKKTKVVSFNTRDITDLYDVRIALELCAADSILNKGIDVLDRLREKAQKFQGSFSGEIHLREFVTNDILFHRLIIELSDNTRLLDMWNRIQSQLLTLLYCFSKGQTEEFLRSNMGYDHDAILDAFDKKDLDLLHKVLTVHIKDCIDYLLAYYDNPAPKAMR